MTDKLTWGGETIERRGAVLFLRISTDLAESIKDAAFSEGVSVNYWCAKTLLNAVQPSEVGE